VYNTCEYIKQNKQFLEVFIVKKLIALTLILVLAFSFTIPALAASGGDSVRAKVQSLQGKFTSAEAQKAISDALSWLAKDENRNSITAEQAATINSNIDAAVATAGTSTLANLSAADRDKIIGNINAAAAALGWNATLGTNNVFTVTDADGKAVTSISVGNTIKQTGIDTTLLIIIIVGITLVFGAAVVVAVTTRNKRAANGAA